MATEKIRVSFKSQAPTNVPCTCPKRGWFCNAESPRSQASERARELGAFSTVTTSEASSSIKTSILLPRMGGSLPLPHPTSSPPGFSARVSKQHKAPLFPWGTFPHLCDVTQLLSFLPPGCAALRLHLRPGVPQHRQIPCHRPPHEVPARRWAASTNCCVVGLL